MAVRLAPNSGDAIIALISGAPGRASSVASEWVLWQTAAPDLFSIDRALNSALIPAVLGCLVILLCFAMATWRARR